MSSAEEQLSSDGSPLILLSLCSANENNYSRIKHISIIFTLEITTAFLGRRIGTITGSFNPQGGEELYERMVGNRHTKRCAW